MKSPETKKALTISPHRRQLLVVQQVTASNSDIQVVECDKAEKSFAIHYIADLRPADGDTRRTC
ncbi:MULTISPECIES: hypothetical protein [Paraburkholderia]|uniref:hypothetical protein n=1 Tax=Paraburkholderia TaxID=1822464 RepID=UPI00115FB929|nr:hypothetical protein [Paraburkholderia hospita]